MKKGGKGQEKKVGIGKGLLTNTVSGYVAKIARGMKKYRRKQKQFRSPFQSQVDIDAELQRRRDEFEKTK